MSGHQYRRSKIFDREDLDELNQEDETDVDDNEELTKEERKQMRIKKYYEEIGQNKTDLVIQQDTKPVRTAIVRNRVFIERQPKQYFIGEVIATLPILILRQYQESWAKGWQLDENPFPIYGVPNALIDAGLMMMIVLITENYSDDFKRAIAPDRRNLLNSLAYLAGPSTSFNETQKKHFVEMQNNYNEFLQDPLSWINRYYKNDPLSLNDKIILNERHNGNDANAKAYKFMVYVKLVIGISGANADHNAFKERATKTIQHYWKFLALPGSDQLELNMIHDTPIVLKHLEEFQSALDRSLEDKRKQEETIQRFLFQVAANLIAGNVKSVLGICAMGLLATVTKYLNVKPSASSTTTVAVGLMSSFGSQLAVDYLPQGLGFMIGGTKQIVDLSGNGVSATGSLLGLKGTPLLAGMVVSMPLLYTLRIALIKQSRLLNALGVPEGRINKVLVSMTFIFDLVVSVFAHRQLQDPDEIIGGFRAERYIVDMAWMLAALNTITLIYEIVKPSSGVNKTNVSITPFLTILGATVMGREQYYSTNMLDATSTRAYQAVFFYSLSEITYNAYLLRGMKIKDYGEEVFDENKLAEIIDGYGDNVYEVSEGNNVVNFGIYKLEVVYDKYRNLGDSNQPISDQGYFYGVVNPLKDLWDASFREQKKKDKTKVYTGPRKAFKMKDLLMYEKGRYARLSYDAFNSAGSLINLMSESTIARNQDLLVIWLVSVVATQGIFTLYRLKAGNLREGARDRAYGIFRVKNVEYLEYDFASDIKVMKIYYTELAMTRTMFGNDSGRLSGLINLIKKNRRPVDINEMYDMINNLDLEPIMSNPVNGFTIEPTDVGFIGEAVKLSVEKMPAKYGDRATLSRVELIKLLLKMFYLDLDESIYKNEMYRDRMIRYMVFLIFSDGKETQFYSTNRVPGLPDTKIAYEDVKKVKFTLLKTPGPELEMLQFQNLVTTASIMAILVYKFAWGRDVNLIPFLKQPASDLYEKVRIRFIGFVDEVVVGIIYQAILKAFAYIINDIEKVITYVTVVDRNDAIVVEPDRLRVIQSDLNLVQNPYREGWVPVTVQIVRFMLEYIIEQVQQNI